MPGTVLADPACGSSHLGGKALSTLPLQPQSKLLGAAWAGTFHPCALVASLFAEPASKTVPKSSQESHDLASFAIAINYWTNLNVSLPPLDQPEHRRISHTPSRSFVERPAQQIRQKVLNRGEGSLHTQGGPYRVAGGTEPSADRKLNVCPSIHSAHFVPATLFFLYRACSPLAVLPLQ